MNHIAKKNEDEATLDPHFSVTVLDGTVRSPAGLLLALLPDSRPWIFTIFDLNCEKSLKYIYTLKNRVVPLFYFYSKWQSFCCFPER